MKTITPDELDAIIMSIRATKVASDRILDELYKTKPDMNFIKERVEAIQQMNSNSAEALDVANLI